jgi:hypothetical protein
MTVNANYNLVTQSAPSFESHVMHGSCDSLLVQQCCQNNMLLLHPAFINTNYIVDSFIFKQRFSDTVSGRGASSVKVHGTYATRFFS